MLRGNKNLCLDGLKVVVGTPSTLYSCILSLTGLDTHPKKSGQAIAKKKKKEKTIQDMYPLIRLYITLSSPKYKTNSSSQTVLIFIAGLSKRKGGSRTKQRSNTGVMIWSSMI